MINSTMAKATENLDIKAFVQIALNVLRINPFTIDPLTPIRIPMLPVGCLSN